MRRVPPIVSVITIIKVITVFAIIAPLVLLATPAHAATKTYVLAIGNNAPPIAAAADEELAPLRYADDDAAAFFTFARSLPNVEAPHLLTILDGESQRRFPDAARVARPPTLVELKRTVAQLKTRLEADRAHNDDPVLLVFYSGHGSRGTRTAPPSLALLDGALTQAMLYDEILAALPARYVHLLVDACHAEAIVRPRDAQAETVELPPRDVQSYATRETLARFPHVGATIATATAAQAHEWDVYQRGVFSHEVVSGLRGAADVNRDGRVEYSELSAFLAAANREVADPRARLDVIARAPSLNRRAPIVDLSALPAAEKLRGRVDALGWFHVEDERGNRLLDLRGEPGFLVALALPAKERLFVRSRDGEAELRANAPRPRLEELVLAPHSVRVRGAMGAAMQRGLFAAAYGPLYYRGYVDRHDEMTPVPSPPEPEPAPLRSSLSLLPTPTASPLGKPSRVTRRDAYATFGVAGGLAAVSVISFGFALKALDDFNSTSLQRPATDAANRFTALGSTAIVTFLGAGVTTGIASWLLTLTAKPRQESR